MFQIGESVVYRNEVCKIKEIKKNHLLGKDYYIMYSIFDSTLTIEVPVEYKNRLLRSVMTEVEAHELLMKIPLIEPIDHNNRFIENEYHQLMVSGDQEDLIKIIKTTYLKNKERLTTGKKCLEKDNIYFEKAERLLYNELSICLHKSYDETRQYVIDTVMRLENNHEK